MTVVARNSAAARVRQPDSGSTLPLHGAGGQSRDKLLL